MGNAHKENGSNNKPAGDIFDEGKHQYRLAIGPTAVVKVVGGVMVVKVP